jgi:hypothetical protein
VVDSLLILARNIGQLKRTSIIHVPVKREINKPKQMKVALVLAISLGAGSGSAGDKAHKLRGKSYGTVR